MGNETKSILFVCYQLVLQLKKKAKHRFCTLRDDVLLWAEDENGVAKGNLTLDGAGYDWNAIY